VENSAGSVTAQQMHTAILTAQQMFISEVLGSNEWTSRL
jgi:hypothetical protein